MRLALTYDNDNVDYYHNFTKWATIAGINGRKQYNG